MAHLNTSRWKGKACGDDCFHHPETHVLLLLLLELCDGGWVRAATASRGRRASLSRGNRDAPGSHVCMLSTWETTRDRRDTVAVKTIWPFRLVGVPVATRRPFKRHRRGYRNIDDGGNGRACWCDPTHGPAVAQTRGAARDSTQRWVCDSRHLGVCGYMLPSKDCVVMI